MDTPSRLGWAIAIIVTGVIAAGLATIIMLMIRRGAARHKPTWRRFCRALKLSVEERGIAEELARIVGASHPASVLISEGTFATAAKRYVGRHGRQPLLERLRVRVFEEA